MTEDPVDRLLKELDVALAVEPSPSVTAGVRRQIETHDRSSAMGFRPWLAAAVAIAVAVAGYAVWQQARTVTTHEPRLTSAGTTPVAATASASSLSVPAPVESAGIATPRAPMPSPRATRRAATTIPVGAAVAAPDVEPEVIISPAVRQGLEQLRAAVAAGQITAESFVDTEVKLELTVVAQTVVVLQPLTLDSPSADYTVAPVSSGDEPTGPDAFPEVRPQFLPTTPPTSYVRSSL